MSSSNPEPQSLASIFGSKATGPRLNRHAPQVDVSDQPVRIGASFMQDPRIRPNAGVALPGLSRPPPPKQVDSTPQTNSDSTPPRESFVRPSNTFPAALDKPKEVEKDSILASSNVPAEATSTVSPYLMRRTQETPSTRAVLPTSQSPQPTSLASIFGSNSTGPRLNKHAAQADVSDQPDRVGASFMQNELTRPGGSLMSQNPSLQRSRSSNVPQISKTSSPLPPQRSTTLPASTTDDENALEQISSGDQRVVPKEDRSNGISSPELQRPVTPQGSPEPPQLGGPTTPRAKPSGTTLGFTGTPPQSPHRIVSPPTLARPIQPSPSTPNKVFQIPQSSKVSPAFLRPLPAKELTPSLTRLQGRGFVAKSVQAVAGTQAPAPPDPKPVNQAGMMPAQSIKKSSVLDRWPGASDSIAPSDRSSGRASPLKNRVYPASATTPVIIRPAITSSVSASGVVSAIESKARYAPGIALPGLATGKSMPSRLASIGSSSPKSESSDRANTQELSMQDNPKPVTLSHVSVSMA